MSKLVASDPTLFIPKPGDVIGDVYRVKRIIHEGSHGVVVEAEQLRLGRRVALKTLGSRVTKDPAAQRRLTKEAEVIGKLDHPHIVHVLDFNRTPAGVPYLVMELLTGQLLSSLLAPSRPFEIPRALRIGSHVASALAAAHATGITHRSLNPTHVDVSDQGDGPFARVIGFGGSARTTSGQSGEHELALSSRYPSYVAPELRKPGGPASDELGDQYALAMLIYHMLTGFAPEHRGGMLSLFRRGQASIDPPSSHRSGIPPALDRVILRALSQDPASRYPKLSEFAAGLLEAGRNYLRRSASPTMRSGPGSIPPVSAARSRISSYPDRDSTAREEHTAEFLRAGGPVSRPVDSFAVGRPKMASTPSNLSNELSEVESLIRSARSAKNLEEAVPAVLRTMELASKTSSMQVERRVSDNHRFFEEILQSYLAVPESLFRAQAQPREVSDPSVLSPKRAFLLSRVDGEMTSGEILQLSPLPRLETMTHLAVLLRAGFIEMTSR